MNESLEKQLAYHCSPTLEGIKTGNIFSLRNEDFPRLAGQVASYEKLLKVKGIHIQIICRCQKRSVVYVYNEAMLRSDLSEHKNLLYSFGYHKEWDLEKTLMHLFRRIATNPQFPHEIGLFLGYPKEDVLGFMQHGGKDFKLNGYWKVYGDPEKTKDIFDQYQRSRKKCCKKIQEGTPLIKLVKVA